MSRSLDQMRVLLPLLGGAVALAFVVGCAAGAPTGGSDGPLLQDGKVTAPDRARPLDRGPRPDRNTTPDRTVRKDGPTPKPDLRPRPDLKPPPPDKGSVKICPDNYEPNSNCSGAVTLASVNEGKTWTSRSGTISPATDVDWYLAKGLEASHLCVPGTSQKYTFTVRLLVPAGRMLKVCLYQDSCLGTSSCKDNMGMPGPTTLELSYGVKGICTVNDDTEARIMVHGVDGKHTCDPYTLQLNYK